MLSLWKIYYIIMSVLIAPSLLAADFLNLKKEVEMLNKTKTDWLHLDVMDGVFVPNISFGFPVIEQVAKVAQKPMDAHLMIENPDKFISRFADLGVYMLTVHYEACTHLHATVMKIKEAGMKAGVALNPGTPVELLVDILGDIDMVLIMSVNPGFGGQKFIPRSLEKVRRLKKMIAERNLDVLIQVDGGINLETGKQIVEAGADVLVAGNFVFNSESPEDIISKMKQEM